MQFRIGEAVVLGGKPGVVRALVRPDDDPRKCVPPGFRFRLAGDLPEREHVSYLVESHDRQLRWSRNKPLQPLTPAPSPSKPAPPYRSVKPDAQEISDGTMASLTGLADYGALVQVRQQFVQHVIATEGCGERYSSWIDAWRWFVNGGAGDSLPAYDQLDRLYVLVHAGPAPGGAHAFQSFEGEEWISADDAPAPLDVAAGRPGNLARVGFLRRHWFVGRPRDAFEKWLAAYATNPTIN